MLKQRQRFGPLSVQRPFYPEDSVCHTYLLHPPGGIVSGDRLCVDVTVDEHAHALLTAPGATKCYRSSGARAEIDYNFRLTGNCEWLPHETIFFNGAYVRQKTTIELGSEARFFGWEVNCLGRTASGEKFDRGSIDLVLEVALQGEPLFIERVRVDPMAGLGHSASLCNHTVFATAIAYPFPESHTEEVRLALYREKHGGYFSITAMDEIVIARYLGDSSLEAIRWFRSFWSRLRPIVLERPSCPPRIWNT
ncbi:MAG: urease accessory protein UreD [Pseudomonadota bacterium]